MQICNQLSQNERNASQQLQRCIQLAQQISSQMNQLGAGMQMGAPGYGMGAQAGGFNVSQGTGAFSPGMTAGSQFGGTPVYGVGQWTSNVGFEMAREFGGAQTQHPVFNTNKDRNE